MDLSTMVLVAVISLIVISVLSKLSKSLFRVGGLLLIAFAAYAMFSGNSLFSLLSPSIDKVLERNNIVELNDRFCTPEKADKTICACIVGPIFTDIEARLGTRALKNMVNDPDALKTETLNSLEYIRPNMDDCLKSRGQDKLKILELIKNNIPIGN